jgi:hypothetical protein
MENNLLYSIYLKRAAMPIIRGELKMAKKNHFLVVDTETTQTDMVADFGATITDVKGNIITSCGVMVNGIFTDSENHPLFFDSNLPSDALWSRDGADKRYKKYNDMVKSGSRMIASVNAINRWLEKANAQYKPILTAYNIGFDLQKCRNTAIDLDIFENKFDLMAIAQTLLINNKNFLKFCLENHCFNPPTKKRNMTFQMKAETVGSYVKGYFSDEPHTALEDIIDFEIPILKYILKRLSVKKILNSEYSAISWNNRQVKDYFRVK